MYDSQVLWAILQALLMINRKLDAVLASVEDADRIAKLTDELAGSSHALAQAVAAAGGMFPADDSTNRSRPQPQPKEVHMASPELDALTKQVTATTDVESSAATLLGGLKKALDDAIATNDPAALKKLSSDLGASQTALAAAVAANTPAVPPAPAQGAQATPKKHP